MSLLPMLFSSWWEDLEGPHHLFDQQFGLSLNPEDLPTSALAPHDTDILVLRPRRRGPRRYQPYERSVDRRFNGSSIVQAHKNKFEVTLDVQQFAPEEVTVKVVGKNVVVEAKHEERQDAHGWISRQFQRKYLVPEQCDIDELKSSMSSDGVLTITAPKKQSDPEKKNERIIKIQSTGQPAIRGDTKPVEKQVEENSAQENTQHRGQQEKTTVKAA